MSEPNLKTCECYPARDRINGQWRIIIVKCPHCIEAEKVAKDAVARLGTGPVDREIIDRARACKLLER
jgi:hypothetical protein